MTTGHVHATRPLTYLITAAEMYLHRPRLIDPARTWMKISIQALPSHLPHVHRLFLALGIHTNETC
jgi:hypothetical protein